MHMRESKFAAGGSGTVQRDTQISGDVPADSTVAVDIGWLATAGITRGCNTPDNDLFCPEDPVTRGQLAAFLRRALG